MANALLKSVNFTKLLNGRLSFRSVKSYYFNRGYVVQSYKQIRQAKAYATAAYKLKLNEDSVVRNNIATSNRTTKNIQSIEDALSKIDSLVKRIGRTQMKHVSDAFSLVTNKEMTSSMHGLYLIRCCKYCIDEPPAKRVELVNQIWNKYQELGIEFDVKHYNALLDVHINNGYNFDPVEILSSMEGVDIKPNKATYKLIMKKYCEDGNIAGASEILEHMKKEGLSADEDIFNYLIEGHIKNKDVTGAKDIIEMMRTSNLQPNSYTHSILACGYAEAGEKNEMISCLKECGEVNTAEFHLKAIDALAVSGNHQYIDDVLSLIQDKEKYQQEFINAAVELLHKNQEHSAYKLAVVACNEEYNEGSVILIKQMIRTQKPIAEILHFCQRFLDEGLNSNIYLIASRIAADNGLLDHAVPLFKKMMEKGYYVRPSNFWPLFKTLKKQQSTDLFLILKKMNELGIPADFTTYFDITYPALRIPEPEDILQNVKESGQTVQTAADALFLYYCNLGEIGRAEQLTQLFPVSIGPRFDIETFLNNSVNLSKEVMNKYLKILKYLFMDIDNSTDHIVTQGKLLALLIVKKMNILETLLNKYEDMKFNRRVLNFCEQEIIQKNPARQAYVKKLRSISLERDNMFMKENISVEDEKKYIYHLEAQNISCRPFLTKRVLYYIKTKNLTRVAQLMALFDELKLACSPLIFANLMSMYCAVGDIEKARETLNELTTEFPSFKLDVTKLLDYTTSLMKYGKIDESFEFLKTSLKEPYNYTNKEIVLKNLKAFNMVLSDVADIEFIKKMQDLLLPLSEEIGSRKSFLSPLIYYHIRRNDLSSAFQEFNNAVSQHRTPACLNNLLRKCVNMNDKETLQKVIDLTISCSGKPLALLELAVVFIETFNTQKAVKIIESLGKEIDNRTLGEICMKLSDQNKLAELEQLIYITRSLNHVDRESLYMHAFKACANRKDFERAEKLYGVLKEEGIVPKFETTNFLENLLTKQSKSGSSTSVSKAPSEAREATKTFLEHLEGGNAEAALDELKILKKGYIRTLSLNTLTDLIDLCLQKNCTTDLSLNVHAMSYIIENVREILKPILEKYSTAGDIEKMVAITAFIPDFSLMNIGFNSYFCKAFISAGEYERLLSELEQRIDKKNKLFSGIVFEELLKFPQYHDRVFNLALKYFDANYNYPIAVIWAHYFINENFEKADEIFKKYSIQPDRNDIVMRYIKQSQNVSFALRYVDFVKNLTVRSRVKERAFGAALELLVKREMYDEAVALVIESEKLNLLLYKYYINHLIALRNALEKENKPIPFSLPLDATSNLSPDSE